VRRAQVLLDTHCAHADELGGSPLRDELGGELPGETASLFS
jgi:hypothetical protein